MEVQQIMKERREKKILTLNNFKQLQFSSAATATILQQQQLLQRFSVQWGGALGIDRGSDTVSSSTAQ
jgi:hypothetical protein